MHSTFVYWNFIHIITCYICAPNCLSGNKIYSVYCLHCNQQFTWFMLFIKHERIQYERDEVSSYHLVVVFVSVSRQHKSQVLGILYVSWKFYVLNFVTATQITTRFNMDKICGLFLNACHIFLSKKLPEK